MAIDIRVVPAPARGQRRAPGAACSAAAGLRASFLIGLSAALVLFLTTSAKVSEYDEGLILTGALRVLHGEWPSRDFYANYGPAQFALVAAAFKLFGTSVLVARVWDSLAQAALVALVWLALRPLRSPGLRSGGTLAALAWLVGTRLHLYPTVPSTALAFGIALVVARGLARRATWAAHWPAAPLTTVLLLFRLDFAAGVVLAVTGAAGLVLLVQQRRGEIEGRRALAVLSGLAGLFGLGAGVGLVLLAWLGVLSPELSDLLAYNTHNYVAMRSLAFPGLHAFAHKPLATVLVYFAPVVALVALLLLLPRARRSVPGEAGVVLGTRAVHALVFLALTVLFCTKGLVRISAAQMLGANEAALVLLCVLLDLRTEHGRRERWPHVAGACALALAAGRGLSKSTWVAGHWDRHGRELPELAGFDLAPERIEAARYLRAVSAPDARILAATGRHDKIFINDNSLYFFAQRLPGTRWHHYDPGVQTTARVQGEMIAELERQRVRWIVRDPTWDETLEPNRSAESSGVELLDDFIDTHYHEVERFGALTVLEANDAR